MINFDFLVSPVFWILWVIFGFIAGIIMVIRSNNIDRKNEYHVIDNQFLIFIGIMSGFLWYILAIIVLIFYIISLFGTAIAFKIKYYINKRK